MMGSDVRGLASGVLVWYRDVWCLTGYNTACTNTAKLQGHKLQQIQQSKYWTNTKLRLSATGLVSGYWTSYKATKYGYNHASNKHQACTVKLLAQAQAQVTGLVKVSYKVQGSNVWSSSKLTDDGSVQYKSTNTNTIQYKYKYDKYNTNHKYNTISTIQNQIQINQYK